MTALGATDRRSSGWDIRNAPKNYASLIIFQVASAALSFGAVWLISRRLGPEGNGTVTAVIAASQIAQILVNWTSVAVVRFGVDEFIETGRIARTFWTRLIVLLVNLALALALSRFWFPPLADWLKMSPDAFWLVAIYFGVIALWVHVQMSLQGTKMLRVQGFLQMLERLIIFAGVLALFVSGRLEYYWAVVFYIAGPAVMIFAGTILLRRYIFSRFSFDAAFARKMLLYSLPLLPFTLVGVLSGSYFDAIFVAKFLSVGELGVYSIATAVNGIAMQVPMLANTVLLPLFVSQRAEGGDQRSFTYFRNILPGITLFWGLGCTSLAFGAYFMIPIVFKPEYAGAVLPLWILLSASVVLIPAVVGYSALANSTSTTYIPMIAGTFAAITNIGANFVLIPRYGMAGCAWATLISYFISTALFGLLLKRTAKMPISWSLVAILPSIAGAILFYAFQNAFIGLAAGIAASLLVGLLFRESLATTMRFLKDLRTARPQEGE